MWLARQQQEQSRQACRDHLFPFFRRLLGTSLRLFSPSAGRGSAPLRPAKPPQFVVDYLVSSCGLSGAEALRASQPLAHLKSFQKPNAVLRLLRQEGLGDAHIKGAVLNYPRLLLADAKKTLEPKIRALQGAALSRSEIAQLMSLNPIAIYHRDLPRRVQFWRELVGSNQNLFRTMKGERSILCYDLNKRVIPGLAALRGLGVRDDKLCRLVLLRPRLVFATTEWLRSRVEQVKSLGFSPGSRMFVKALLAVASLSGSTLDAKFKLLRSFGWTQAELISAIQRFPSILTFSEKKIQAAMDILLKDAGCEPSFLVRHPVLLGLSVEERLMPRCYVLQSLKSKGLLLSAGSRGFLASMKATEAKFIHQYVAPYCDKLPGLLEAYRASVTKKAKA